MLLVLGDVAGDRLVAELRELDPHLVRGDPVRAVADDGPVAAARARGAARPRRSSRAGASTSRIASGSSRSATRQLVRCARRSASSAPSSAAMREREQEAGRDLRVERLGRRDAHLDVAPVGRVEHAVGLVDEIALAPVHDRDHERAAGAREVDGAVRVGGGARLADRDDERVAHVGREPEARELGGEHRLDRRRDAPGERAAQRAARGSGPRSRRCPARSRAPGGSSPARSRVAASAGQRLGGERARRAGRRARRSWPRSVLRNDAGASVISFSRKCGDVAAVDVARRDLRRRAARRSSTGSARAVVRQPRGCRRACRRARAVEHDDLTLAAPGCPGSTSVSPSRRRYGRISSTRPYGSLATTNASSASPT